MNTVFKPKLYILTDIPDPGISQIFGQAHVAIYKNGYVRTASDEDARHFIQIGSLYFSHSYLVVVDEYDESALSLLGLLPLKDTLVFILKDEAKQKDLINWSDLCSNFVSYQRHKENVCGSTYSIIEEVKPFFRKTQHQRLESMDSKIVERLVDFEECFVFEFRRAFEKDYLLMRIGVS